MAKIKVLFIDPQTDISDSLLTLLQTEPDIASVAGAYDPCDAAESFGEIPTDIVIMNLNWPLSESLEAIHGLRETEPGIRVVVLSGQENPETMFMVLRAGAHGLLLSRTADRKIADAIRAVYGGGTYVSNDVADIMIPHYLKKRGAQPVAGPLGCLSNRELEVLTLVIDGKPSSEIAQQLSISRGSVDTYRNRLMKKLGVQDLPSLVKFAIQHGVASVDRV